MSTPTTRQAGFTRPTRALNQIEVALNATCGILILYNLLSSIKNYMKYPDGVEMRLGDRVSIFGNELATIVIAFDVDEYSAEFTKDSWGYLLDGILVRTDGGALARLTNMDEGEIHRIL